uniref:Uncharacterized protein n=1 Tax=Meloidogyne enterolobii TaxID=390850 RepID=A0A6V7VP23_MELEN|nr:unnamed protein product [Meloidogyne enterolobii]
MGLYFSTILQDGALIQGGVLIQGGALFFNLFFKIFNKILTLISQKNLTLTF